MKRAEVQTDLDMDDIERIVGKDGGGEGENIRLRKEVKELRERVRKAEGEVVRSQQELAIYHQKQGGIGGKK